MRQINLTNYIVFLYYDTRILVIKQQELHKATWSCVRNQDHAKAFQVQTLRRLLYTLQDFKGIPVLWIIVFLYIPSVPVLKVTNCPSSLW